MNEYIFYTTEGQTLAPNPDYSIENCQVLGKARGETLEIAKRNLFRDNPWIEEAGYSSKCIMAEQILTEELRKKYKL